MRIGRFVKKASAAAACLLLAGSLLAGCSSSAAAYDPQAVCARFGDTEISAAEASFYVRDKQYMYEMLYSTQMEDLWNMQITEYLTMEDSVKESAMNELHQTYILMGVAEEMGLSLTAEQIGMAHDAADEYYDSHEGAFTDAVGADREAYHTFFEHNALAVLAYQAAIDGVSTVVTDEEARHNTVQVLALNESSTDYDAETMKDSVMEMLEDGSTPDEVAEAFEEQALSFTEYHVGDGDFDSSFGPDAFGLQEGEFTAVYSESATCWYVIYCSEYINAEATANGHADVISHRQTEAFETAYAEWRESAPAFTVDEDVLAAIDLSQAVYTVPETVPETAAPAPETEAAGEDETEG